MKVLIVFSLLTLISCAMPVQRHRVSFDRPQVKKLTTRAEKYMNCITKLSNIGIQQKLIQNLCNASFGSIE